MNNGYSSATGQQDILSSEARTRTAAARASTSRRRSKSLGVPWIKRVRTYGVAGVLDDPARGDGRARQGPQGHHRRRRMPARAPAPHAPGSWPRRWRPASAWCARASGSIRRCARATIPASACRAAPRSPSSPARIRCAPIPVAHVNNDCVGCGLCGEVAHAAQLCPSFAQIDIIQNPSAWDRLRARLSAALIRLLGGARRAMTPRRAGARAGGVSSMAEAKPITPADRRARRRGRRRAGVLAAREAAIASGHFVQPHLHSGRRPAHRRHHLLPRDGARRRRAHRRRRRPVWRSTRRPARSTSWWSRASCWRRRAHGAGGLCHARPHAARSPRRRVVSTSTRRSPWATAGSSEEPLRGALERFSQRVRARRLCGRRGGEQEPAQRRAAGRAGRPAACCRSQPEAFRATIRAEGKAVDANLRGFEAGLGVARAASDPIRPHPERAWRRHPGHASPCGRSGCSPRPSRGSAPDDGSEHAFPAEAHAVLRRRRSSASPTTRTRAYAQRYLTRVHRFVGKPGADGAFIARARPPPRRAHERGGRDPRGAAEAARGTAGARHARGARRAPGDIVDVTEYMKPGPEEVLRPAAAAARALGAGARAPRPLLAAQGHDHAAVGLPAAQGCWPA